MFNTTLSQEYRHAAENFDLSNNELVSMTLNSIDYSFASEQEKSKLKACVKKWQEDNSHYFK